MSTCLIKFTVNHFCLNISLLFMVIFFNYSKNIAKEQLLREKYNRADTIQSI